MQHRALLRNLRKRLRDLLVAAQGTGPRPLRKLQEDEYDAAIDSVRKRVPILADQVRRNRELVRSKLVNIVDAPEGRRETLLRSSPPSTLVALAYELMRQSYEQRFGNVRRSLRLAEMAAAAARASDKDGYLAPHTAADLIGEALLYLGNARRLVSDLAGAESTFNEARLVLQSGTGDRSLKADLLDFLGSLFLNQRRLGDATGAFDREIKIRRLLGDPNRLGAALINRGVVATQREDLALACDSFSEGLELVDDRRLFLVALVPLATAMARAGKGAEAWTIISRAETVALLVGSDEQRAWINWTKGLASLALGKLAQADGLLASAQERLLSDGRTLSAAYVSLDRACVLAALGRNDELAAVMSAAYEVFKAERLGERALAAFMMLHRAVEKGNASAQLAIEVANFIARSRYDRNIRFERRST